MINSRSLEELSLKPRKVAAAHVEACKRAGIELLITSTYRDGESQTELYAIGRTKEIQRRTVTDARAGESWHNYRCAWDVVPLIGGKCVWDEHASVWKEVLRLGTSVGAELGPKWEMCHFQVKPPGMDLKTALERFRENGTIFL